MSKGLLFLVCLGLGVIALTSAGAFASAIEVRIATGSDDVEEYVEGHDMYVDSSDLEMPYEDDPSSAGDKQVIGLRFAVPIPKGAQITKAYVEFSCDETKNGTNPVNLIIQGQLAANAPAFTTASADVTSRTPTKAQVKWAVENWTTTGQKSQTPDIKMIIQEIIDQPGWASGNALVLVFSDDALNPSRGIRCADAIEDGATLGPLLHIEIFNAAASSPSPADGALGVSMALLGWTKGDGAVFHNVYFGTTPDLTEANLVAKNQPFAMYYHVAGLEVGTKYYWRVDELDATGKLTTGPVWSFTSELITAYAPKPADGAADLFPAATLSWLPGKLALQHQLFFSNSLADVTDGKPAADKGKLTDTKFNTGVLRSSSVYYWRVDEITASGTINKGPVWSFTTADGAAKKIVSQWWFNISGGAITDLTGNSNYPNNPTGTELRDDFQGRWENEYDYYGMRVYGWLNPPKDGDYTFWIAANDVGECWLSTDADPANAKMICSVPSGSGGDPRQWDGATAQKSAPITLKAGQKYFIMALQKDNTGRDHVAVAWQGAGVGGQAVISSQYVDTFALPPLTAFSPSPANTEAAAAQDGALSWNAGDQAQKHDVYFGDDKAAVAAADTKSPLYKGQQTGTTFDAGDLEWAKTYYWRVDEIDAAGATNAGPVWSFTTADFILVDNMESYNDDLEAKTTIFDTWIDGLTNGLSGSTVGNFQAPFAERTIVHGGKQSMPMDYDNSKTPFFSEAVQEFSPLQNWTVNGVTNLTLYFRGVATNGAGSLYVAVGDSSNKVAVVTNSDAAAVQTETWTEWKIPLSSLTGVNLAKVKTLYIGVGDKKSPAAGGTGRIYIDDIRVTKP
jgi:hypothetical protein